MSAADVRLRPVPRGKRLRLADTAAQLRGGPLDRREVEQETARLLERLESLQAAFHADGRRALLLVLQGRDASGKDGTIRTVVGACNPMGVRVASFGPPSERELSHDYLWRVHQVLPPTGVIGVFNRSHYEDLLVVRVRELVPKAVWLRRYRHIVEFERMLADSGTTILKCFLHVSRDEQRRRLQERLDDPRKNWKFRLGDLDDRARWDDYTRAYRAVLARTSTAVAPWFVVPADDKKVRNLLIARLLVDTLEQLDPTYPRMAPEVAQAAVGFE